MAEKDDYLVDILVDLGFVTADQVASLRPEAQSAGVGLVDLMLANKMVPPAAVTQAKAAAGGKNVYVIGGASIDQQLIAAGLADELRIDLIPVLLGGGVRLFDELSGGPVRLEQVRSTSYACEQLRQAAAACGRQHRERDRVTLLDADAHCPA